MGFHYFEWIKDFITFSMASTEEALVQFVPSITSIASNII